MLPIEGSACGAEESSVAMNSSRTAEREGLVGSWVRGVEVVVGREVGAMRGGL